MPAGVVEDSRSSHNPRWGYLKLIDSENRCCAPSFKEHTEILLRHLEDANESTSLKNLQSHVFDQAGPLWDRLLFISKIDVIVNDKVCFDLEKVTLRAYGGIPVHFWVAVVTSKIND